MVSTGRFTGTVKGTGRHIDVPIAHVFIVRKGKIARWVGYADTARVAEAFGFVRQRCGLLKISSGANVIFCDLAAVGDRGSRFLAHRLHRCRGCARTAVPIFARFPHRRQSQESTAAGLGAVKFAVKRDNT